MLLVDVNVLVGAMREDAPRHAIMRPCLEALRARPEPFALCEPVVSGALRILTHPRVFSPPTPVALAVAYARRLRDTPNALVLAPGTQHWALFLDLVQRSAGGNLLSDAWIAALALEHGCTVLTDDTDFARFSGVRWCRPEEVL